MSLQCWADLHIHTALSPCASNEMTPLTIIEKSVTVGLKLIAITDHNSSCNVAAVQEASKNYPLEVIPGIEVQSKEEVHLVCLFPDIKKCFKFQKIVDNNLPQVKNKEQFFGEQIIFDLTGKPVGQEEKMLLNSVTLTIDEIFFWVKKYAGICIPAHIDRPSYSLLANLGTLPRLDYPAFEVASIENIAALKTQFPELNDYSIICNSDAHYPDMIGRGKTLFKINTKSFKEVINALAAGKEESIFCCCES